jgi:hypothetical protein
MITLTMPSGSMPYTKFKIATQAATELLDELETTGRKTGSLLQNARAKALYKKCRIYRAMISDRDISFYSGHYSATAAVKKALAVYECCREADDWGDITGENGEPLCNTAGENYYQPECKLDKVLIDSRAVTLKLRMALEIIISDHYNEHPLDSRDPKRLYRKCRYYLATIWDNIRKENTESLKAPGVLQTLIYEHQEPREVIKDYEIHNRSRKPTKSRLCSTLVKCSFALVDLFEALKAVAVVEPQGLITGKQKRKIYKLYMKCRSVLEEMKEDEKWYSQGTQA